MWQPGSLQWKGKTLCWFLLSYSDAGSVTNENSEGSIFKVWSKLQRSLDVKLLMSAIFLIKSTEGDDELKDGHVGLLLPRVRTLRASEP